MIHGNAGCLIDKLVNGIVFGFWFKASLGKDKGHFMSFSYRHGGEGQQHQGRQKQGNQFFHDGILLLFLILSRLPCRVGRLKFVF